MTVDGALGPRHLAARAVSTELATTVLLAGELDMAGIGTLNRCVEGVLAADNSSGRVVLDAIALHFIDVVGARALIKACDQLAERYELEISWLQPQVRLVLSLVDSKLRWTKVRPKTPSDDKGLTELSG
jgi:anti-anti-sigma regulatory factor